MSLLKEVWVQDIQEVLFSGQHEFLRKSVNHDAFVTDKKVHVPQAGSMPGATKNRSSFPATIVERTDTDLDYNLDSFTTDPIRVRRLDEIQTSYAKRQSVLKQHMNILLDRMDREGIFSWSASLGANIVRTTGTTATDNLAPGATGSRKKVIVDDIKRLAKLMDRQNVPDEGRYLMLPPEMYYELFTNSDLIKSDIIGEITLPSAVVKKILTFNIMKRSDVGVYDNAGTPAVKAIGAATATTDNLVAIAWHQDFVSSALGEIFIFDEKDSATNYGDILSAQVEFATKILRTSEAGVLALVQSA